MTLHPTNITLNVSGRLFEVTPQTIEKIPTIQNWIVDSNTTPKSPLFVERSPMVFDHVLSYVLDPLHPFPKKYFYELDFYGIEYDKDKLYDPHQKTACRIENATKQLGNGITNILDQCAKPKFVCCIKECKSDRYKEYRFCKLHLDI